MKKPQAQALLPVSTLIRYGKVSASEGIIWWQMLGMHGTVAANYAVDHADLLLAIGVRFDDRVTGKLESFAARARIVHVDIDPAEINKNKASHVTVCADAKPSLKVGALSKSIKESEVYIWSESWSDLTLSSSTGDHHPADSPRPM